MTILEWARRIDWRVVAARANGIVGIALALLDDRGLVPLAPETVAHIESVLLAIQSCLPRVQKAAGIVRPVDDIRP